MSKFVQVGATTVHSPSQLVFTLDHDIQNTSASNLRKYAEIASFAAEHGVTAYPKGRGIGHQVRIQQRVPRLLADRIDHGGRGVCLAGHHGGSLG